MGARSEAGNKYLLIIVDRASKFLFAYPLPNKTVENVAKKLLELLLIFGIPLSLPSDPGTEFTAKVVHHLCKWLNVTTDYGSTDHPRAQGAVEKLGRLFHETLQELCKSWPRRWDEYVQPALWLYRTNPDPRLPGKATPFRLLFGRDCRTQMDATSPSPDDDGMESSSTIGEGGDTTILSPGRSPKQLLPGIGLHDPLHVRQACHEFNLFHRRVGQIYPR